ncbi:MAG: translation elongation factor 4 [Candidatus Pacebacteria bacterium]|nr:translation elongation factor 4 [Candidatus Paceibacterota bacterium]
MEIENIRNFCIISHIDHGKSTLADRFLELTNTVPKEKMHPQFLDMMDLEKERGITIKMQPVRMTYRTRMGTDNYADSKDLLYKELTYKILNLIDTPGHVDFSYEVSRGMSAVEGAILLVDATKGIQAQTLANLELAQNEGLSIIPAVNKIDLPQAQVAKTQKEIAEILKIKRDEVLKISAKVGTDVEKILEEVIKKVPPPKGKIGAPLKALIFDSKYDPYLGVIAYVRIFDGKVKEGDFVYILQAGLKVKVKEVGWFLPSLTRTEVLRAGEIGYIALGVKEAQILRIGQTITVAGAEEKVKALPGYKEPKPVVFVSIFPEKDTNFLHLKDGLEKLKLNDPSLFFEPEVRSMLGKGFRCGFLGVLHAEITVERLRREFGLNLMITSPSVVYKILKKNGEEILVYSPKDWPHFSEIQKVYEKFARVKIIVPQKFLSNVLGLIKEKKPIFESLGEKIIMEVKMPLREVIIGFYDKLKSVSEGFASMDYRILDWEETDLVKLEFLIGGRVEEALSKILPRKFAQKEAQRMVEILKENIPPQLFTLPIQARVEGKIIARRNIKARRRDVLAPLYGGDYTRKLKLLERQKRGKKKLKEEGQVSIPNEVFWKIIKLSG